VANVEVQLSVCQAKFRTPTESLCFFAYVCVWHATPKQPVNEILAQATQLEEVSQNLFFLFSLISIPAVLPFVGTNKSGLGKRKF
jgi:hypothetical protein